MRQWITAAEVIDVVHYNHKSRFEVRFKNASYQVRALQGHSIAHVKDELVLTHLSAQEIPEYCAHGTYYDFYESISDYWQVDSKARPRASMSTSWSTSHRMDPSQA